MKLSTLILSIALLLAPFRPSTAEVAASTGIYITVPIFTIVAGLLTLSLMPEEDELQKQKLKESNYQPMPQRHDQNLSSYGLQPFPFDPAND